MTNLLCLQTAQKWAWFIKNWVPWHVDVCPRCDPNDPTKFQPWSYNTLGVLMFKCITHSINICDTLVVSWLNEHTGVASTAKVQRLWAVQAILYTTDTYGSTWFRLVVLCTEQISNTEFTEYIYLGYNECFLYYIIEIVHSKIMQ